jgi:hypothetical protein
VRLTCLFGNKNGERVSLVVKGLESTLEGCKNHRAAPISPSPKNPVQVTTLFGGETMTVP